ncbi:PREDICTED: multisubstrate pseudouridine synthase 7-like isoform X2 [Nelumbo nucifera]|uniref:Multisubstrate pseudouridine synthase 7-like isoform X2 n=1 Tax=Nelumbo nucifera TaxID=4432 RepID=A0A1U8AAN5_NELNU|nr:PREDICTED: multisubstrate pseudouridine synthase 7-like isoform X2 [Nelumbo nucifera]XP_019053545.1 PREDICTED: multisubstrate pseudouridine synthase 7-like isoform X2 [Nelumbo nucifera]
MWSDKLWSFPPSITVLALLKPFKLKPYYYHCNSTKAETLAMTTLNEAGVGIYSYISHLPGFHAVLKQRYSDFIVNEVDSDGKVVHLTCLDAPPEIVAEMEKERGIPDQTYKTYTSEIELFRALAGDSDAESLKSLLNQITSGGQSNVSPIVLSPDSDKSHRTAVHKFFKEHFKFLLTDTVDGPDDTLKCIRVRLSSIGQDSNARNSKKRKDRKDKPFDSRGSNNWPEHVGKFLRFHLYKENKDTQEVLGLLGKMLGIQQRSFGFAGTKDKRSVSTQRVTVFKQYAKRLAALNDRLIGIKVGDFCHVKEELLLGQLLGNRFTITLRGVVADSEDTIKAAVDALGKKGFINYYGLQRFGSGSMPNHLIGATLLRGEWKMAVSMILDPREGEREGIRKAREYYKDSGDIEGTLRQLPHHLVAERAILQCLKKCPGNYLQALKAIPRTLRMMYVHSYQSYLWNHAASIRVQRHGIDGVVIGDLVYSKSGSTGMPTEAISSGFEDDSCNDKFGCSDLDETTEATLPKEKGSIVKAVDAEDLQRGDYTIADVILPLPGSRVLYPTHDIAQVYRDLAKKDGISLMESVHSTKEFSITCMTGGYRHVFQKPIDFDWELIQYIDGNVPLVETDLDVIAKTGPVHNIREEGCTDAGGDKICTTGCAKLSVNLKNDTTYTQYDSEAEDEKEVGLHGNCGHGCDAREPQVALKLGFTLPASCYATMAIRELLKTSTSVAFQKTQNH